MKYRIEHDSMGDVYVEAHRYWGAQTQRSFDNFKIGNEKMPLALIYAFAHLKMACAKANYDAKVLSSEKYELILKVCDEILCGKLDEHFPLSVWQTGSGTQTNMNVNEVIANRGNEIAQQKLLHPNDDVNKSQSSNDTFPSAMHIAAIEAIKRQLLPELHAMIDCLKKLENTYHDVIKIGRTHLQDATPLRFSDEISGWRSMLENNIDMLEKAMDSLAKLAIGGSAVGTGLNTPEHFDQLCIQHLNEQLSFVYRCDSNKFHALSSKDDLCFAHGAIKACACNLMKMANDIRWLASGPRCGIGEIIIPENEPGSSIMPGKVNPTQCEAMTMCAVQIMGNDATIAIASSQGNFELNVFMPVIIYNFLQSTTLLADALKSLRIHCVEGLQANVTKMEDNLYHSLMLVTALNPYIGYEKAAKTAKKAFQENITLKEACVRLGYLTSTQFDEYVDVTKMVK
ncbi:MAG: class II fumarate hydratase [Longicatena sp.]|nr:class II fumarate hydratase [Longicatena sp.]